MRRPPGHAASQHKSLFVLGLGLLLLNPALHVVGAQQHQQHQQQQARDQQASGPDAVSIYPGLEKHVQERFADFAASVASGSSADSAKDVHDILQNGDDSDSDEFTGGKAKNRKSMTSQISPAEAKLYRASGLTVKTPNKDQEQPTEERKAGSARPSAISASSPRNHHHKNNNDNNNLNNLNNLNNFRNFESSNPATTVAPDLSVRAPSPAHRDSAGTTGHSLSSPHIARSLADWEVEDFVLLSTVDGDLHSIDRKTGKALWHIESDKPVVETKHHRINISTLEDSFSPIDKWIWAVEPNRNGAIYLMIPGGVGLADTGLSMKWLVEKVPYYDRDHPVVFTGTKESNMVTLDANTGRVLEWYGADDVDSFVAGQDAPESCMRPTKFDDRADEECSAGGTITLGRTDYKVVIRRNDGLIVATLKYSEWGPNNFDEDLQQQHSAPHDNRYVIGKPNGEVYGFSIDPSSDGGIKPAFSHRLAAPIARVFDIARPRSVPSSSDPDLAVLPQPPPPPENDETVRLRRTSVFMNETLTGSWYALSGTAYPLIVDVPAAECSQVGWWERHQLSDLKDMRAALAGKHSLTPPTRRSTSLGGMDLPGLPAPERAFNDGDVPVDQERPTTNGPFVDPLPEEEPFAVTKMRQLPEVVANSMTDLLQNPVFLMALVFFVFYYQSELRRWYSRLRRQGPETASTKEVEPAETLVDEDDTAKDTLDTSLDGAALGRNGAPLNKNEVADIDDATTKAEANAKNSVKSTDEVAMPAAVSTSSTSPSPPVANDAKTVRIQLPNASDNDSAAAPDKEKKKAHRGRRGGAKHRKGSRAKAETSVSRDDGPTAKTVDEAVDQAKELGRSPTVVEPDIVTVRHDVEGVSGPILRIGDLEVDEDKQLGTGSNGTIVFAGKFAGRDVAVKRMLGHFYDIASHETKLLAESDDHANVIRYYTLAKRDDFHYIALELCEASLAEVIEKPNVYRHLKEAGQRDVPDILYQITSGLDHLHKRNIVHRDLKPQNILVNMDTDGKPRMLISDFGLCKKLEGGQSSFGATTAHAAGTNGWRAPELLKEDDDKVDKKSLMDGMSTQSGSFASGGVIDSTGRRATKSIDIFSLGLVFFYVLTKGQHPFGEGGRYMREINIRNDNYKLDALDMLGDYAYEAKDLIRSMLNKNPRERPRTKHIMMHPFFWPAKKRLNFLCDVSDHFEKEPRMPPSEPLQRLEAHAGKVCGEDFLKKLPSVFIDSLGKQRKYTGSRLLDLLRALRNKRNHYEDMSEALQKMVGSLPEGYLFFWTSRFPNLLITCWRLGFQESWPDTARFADYYQPAKT